MMADGEHSSAVQAWRPGSLSVMHLALGLSVLASLTMAILTIGL